MKRISTIALLLVTLAGAASASGTTPTKSQANTEEADAKKGGHIVISVSGRAGGSAAAYARWHFAQSGDGEGTRRFVRN